MKGNEDYRNSPNLFICSPDRLSFCNTFMNGKISLHWSHEPSVTAGLSKESPKPLPYRVDAQVDLSVCRSLCDQLISPMPAAKILIKLHICTGRSNLSLSHNDLFHGFGFTSLLRLFHLFRAECFCIFIHFHDSNWQQAVGQRSLIPN